MIDKYDIRVVIVSGENGYQYCVTQGSWGFRKALLQSVGRKKLVPND